MPMYRKKPVLIEARCFETNDKQHMDDIVAWILSLSKSHAYHDGINIYIETLEGLMCANVGDYIIKGVSGEFYPCKPDIFEKTYEAA